MGKSVKCNKQKIFDIPNRVMLIAGYRLDWVGWAQITVPCTATNFWSIAHTHLFHSASSPLPSMKYSILYNRIIS
jgi:hypothetical protein